MFLRNSSALAAHLLKANITEDLRVATVVVVETLEAHGTTWQRSSRTFGRPLVEPMSAPIWGGASVTASGRVRALDARGHSLIALRIGSHTRELVTFGERRWNRRDGELVPSAPAPLGEVEVTFENAFGGHYIEPPGVLPGTDLPSPGGRVDYALNPKGTGFYRDERAAEGNPLPRIEATDQLVRHWYDRPRPAGIEPCACLPAMRAPFDNGQFPIGTWFEGELPIALRMLHAAPREQILASLPTGTLVQLKGLGRRSLQLAVPEPPVRVAAQRTHATEIRPALRALHVDVENELAVLVWGFAGRYFPSAPPRFLDVFELAREAA